MAVILDAKDFAKVDSEHAAESLIWSVLQTGQKAIGDADFVGGNEVRVPKFSGLGDSEYVRGADNVRRAVTVTKETRRLEFIRWMSYDLDALDQSESAGYDVMNVVEEHVKSVATPQKDINAAKRLLENAGQLVKESITKANALSAYDAAMEYMVENEVGGPYVLFCGKEYLRALKQADGVGVTFTPGEANLGGIDRRVNLLDASVPVILVPAGRLQQDAAKHVNFILMPLGSAAPIEKYNDITLVPAESDRDGYCDTVKGLNYYDLVILDNQKKGIYVSYKDA